MTQSIYTIGQIAECLECKERTARMLLNVAGANPKFNVYSLNTNEIVTRQTILDLASLRENGRIGRKLSRLLQHSQTNISRKTIENKQVVV